MKRLFLLLIPMMLLVGCAKPPEIITVTENETVIKEVYSSYYEELAANLTAKYNALKSKSAESINAYNILLTQVANERAKNAELTKQLEGYNSLKAVVPLLEAKAADYDRLLAERNKLQAELASANKTMALLLEQIAELTQ